MDEEFKDYTKEAYSITNYDLVYILLKPANHLTTTRPDLVKFDSHRKRHYVTGKIVDIAGYPKYRSLALVPLNDIPQYSKVTKILEKQKFVVNVQFGEIEFITLDFDSLDWKK